MFRTNYKRHKYLKLIIAFAISFSMIFVFPGNVRAATQISFEGFNAGLTGGGGWTSGNLGKTYSEGEWVPYKVVFTNVQDNFPNLDGFQLDINFVFTKNGVRFMDGVRSIQVGTTNLTNSMAWPDSDGTALPIVSRADIEAAQNIGVENTFDDFTLIRLPYDRLNRALDGSLGSTTDSDRKFTIIKQDLLDAGIPIDTTTLVLYFQLHLSRTWIWNNSMQSGYDDGQLADWGGYVYGDEPFASDQRLGSGYIQGSPGHLSLGTLTGSKTVPNPQQASDPGVIHGTKWLDLDFDGIMDPEESGIPDWEIFVTGTLGGKSFTLSTLTDENGNYEFLDLSTGITWTVSEEMVNGYQQTYPYNDADDVGIASIVGITELERALWGWEVPLTYNNSSQENLNFGNAVLGELEVIKTFVDTPDEFMPEFVEVTITGPSYPNGETVKLNDVNNWSYEWLDLIPGDYDVEEVTLGNVWSVDIDNETIAVVPGEGNMVTVNITNTYIPKFMNETAWGFGGSYSKTFNEYGLNNWGWTNGPLTEGFYEFDLYAGAGGNDLSKGILIGTASIEFEDGLVTVFYDVDDDIILDEVHFYIGENPLPKKGKNYTNAPGQLTHKPKNISGNELEFGPYEYNLDEIYVAVHAVVRIPMSRY